MYNKVILVGNLTRDVELKYTPTGTAVSKFGIATNRTYKDTVSGEQKQEVMFIDVTVFGRSAEIANQYLRKGSKTLIEGRLVLDQWIDQAGQKRSKHSVVAERIQFIETKREASQAGLNDANHQNSEERNAEKKQNPSIPKVDINDEDIPF